MTDSRLPVTFARRRLHKAFRLAAVLFVFVGALRWGGVGLEWERYREPDERTIEGWIGQVRESGYVTERVYPGGWFQLFRAGARVAGPLVGSRPWMKQDSAKPMLAGAPEQNPRKTPASVSAVLEGRRLNLLLFALSASLVLLCARECGFGLAAALFGSLFFCFHPLSTEFVHYCSTDMGLAFASALASWLALRAFRTGKVIDALAAASAAGFAIACKYSAIPFAIVPVLLPFAVCPPKSTRQVRATILALLFVALLLGFLAGTPALWRAPSRFLAGSGPIAQATYAETLQTLGDRAGRPFAALSLRIGTIAAETAKIGVAIGGWLLVAAATAFWLGSRRNRMVVPLLAIAFLVYFVFGMPWIRSQETLPLVVSFCAVAGAPVEWSLRTLRRADSGGRNQSASVLVLFAAALALLAAFSKGALVLSSFRAPERRELCRQWLRFSVPDDASFAVDAYAESIARGLPCFHGGVRRWAEYWDGSPVDRRNGADIRYDYFARNSSHVGRDANRSLLRPWRLLPDAAARVAAFEASAPLLAEWRIPNGCARTTFAQHDIELRALPPLSRAGADLPPLQLAFDRPAIMLSSSAPLSSGAEAAPVGPVWAVCASVGAASARLPPAVRPGPDAAGGTGQRVWGVVRSLPGSAPLRYDWTGVFGNNETILPPGSAAVAAPSPSRLFLSGLLSPFPAGGIRIRDGTRNGGALLHLSFRLSEVVRALRIGGDPAGALAFAATAGRDGVPPDTAAELFLAAVESGVEPHPEWQRSAEAALSAFDALSARLGDANAGTADWPESALVCGAPLSALRDFARIRIGNVSVRPGERLPVVLPPGEYRFRFTVQADREAELLAMTPLDGGMRPVPLSGETRRYEIRCRFGHPTVPSVSRTIPAGKGRPLSLRCVEIVWDPVERLAEAAEELRSALGRRP